MFLTASPTSRFTRSGVWGDPRLSLEAMLTAANQKREQLAEELGQLERTKGVQGPVR